MGLVAEVVGKTEEPLLEAHPDEHDDDDGEDEPHDALRELVTDDEDEARFAPHATSPAARRRPARMQSAARAPGAGVSSGSCGAPPGFLFGDSTPSPLTIDFIAFLRDSFDFAVEVLRSDARMAAAVRGVTQLADETEREVALADELAADLGRALEGATLRRRRRSRRAARRASSRARDLVRTERGVAAVAAERARLAQTASQEYAACAKAFEALVPGCAARLGWRRDRGVEGGACYEAVLQCHTPYGLEWTLDLEVPPNHLLLRCGLIGWSIGSRSMRPKRAAGCRRCETVRSASIGCTAMGLSGHLETAVRLRAADDGSGAGFDVLFRTEPTRIELVRSPRAAPRGDAHSSSAATTPPGSTPCAEPDCDRGDLADKKKAPGRHRSAGRPSKARSPRRPVETLIGSMRRPSTIASRSRAGELVIKRLLGDNRREEVFVSKSEELADKVESLPADLRAVFDPLKQRGQRDARPVHVEVTATAGGSGNGSPTVIVTPTAKRARPRVGATTREPGVPGARIQMISSPPPSETPPPPAPAATPSSRRRPRRPTPAEALKPHGNESRLASRPLRGRMSRLGSSRMTGASRSALGSSRWTRRRRALSAHARCSHPPTEVTVVTDHRMAPSVSTWHTVLWDQIEYSRNPSDFSWVLPVKTGTVVQASNDGFEALDAMTTPTITGPSHLATASAAPPASPGSRGRRSTAFGGVEVFQSSVGPRSRGHPVDRPNASSTARRTVRAARRDAADHLGLRVRRVRLHRPAPAAGARRAGDAAGAHGVVTQGAGPVAAPAHGRGGRRGDGGDHAHVIGEGRYEAAAPFQNAVIVDLELFWYHVQNRSIHQELSQSPMAQRSHVDHGVCGRPPRASGQQGCGQQAASGCGRSPTRTSASVPAPR